MTGNNSVFQKAESICTISTSYLATQTFFGSVKKPAFEGSGAAGSALRRTVYFAIQTFFASVKKFNASTPPSRPTPLAFIPTLQLE